MEMLVWKVKGQLKRRDKLTSVGARSKFWGVSGPEDSGGGDNSIQFINFGRVGEKGFKECRQKIGGGGKGGLTTIF